MYGDYDGVLPFPTLGRIVGTGTLWGLPSKDFRPGC